MKTPKEGWPPFKGMIPCWEPGYKPTDDDREALRQLAWAVWAKRKTLFNKKGKRNHGQSKIRGSKPI